MINLIGYLCHFLIFSSLCLIRAKMCSVYSSYNCIFMFTQYEKICRTNVYINHFIKQPPFHFTGQSILGSVCPTELGSES